MPGRQALTLPPEMPVAPGAPKRCPSVSLPSRNPSPSSESRRDQFRPLLARRTGAWRGVGHAPNTESVSCRALIAKCGNFGLMRGPIAVLESSAPSLVSSDGARGSSNSPYAAARGPTGREAGSGRRSGLARGPSDSPYAAARGPTGPQARGSGQRGLPAAPAHGGRSDPQQRGHQADGKDDGQHSDEHPGEAHQQVAGVAHRVVERAAASA